MLCIFVQCDLHFQVRYNSAVVVFGLMYIIHHVKTSDLYLDVAENYGDLTQNIFEHVWVKEHRYIGLYVHLTSFKQMFEKQEDFIKKGFVLRIKVLGE